ncbi:hypothetical protein Ddye_013959 [Dipteronia dyeriana]|uniref:Cytochrome f n=1 Tax=Dipteronia dyeriana TaxID=168575 RepID=A0AAE0CKP8_9ROSI|nr:hypothetical protein Ddye_013959 [Dipteronia dyeriana]
MNPDDYLPDEEINRLYGEFPDTNPASTMGATPESESRKKRKKKLIAWGCFDPIMKVMLDGRQVEHAYRPAPGKKYSEISFSILSPDPATNKDVHFLKYPIYVGGNGGRGQIYPDRTKGNNTVYNATAAGIVSKIIRKEKKGYEITITDALDGRQVVDIIPPGPNR